MIRRDFVKLATVALIGIFSGITFARDEKKNESYIEKLIIKGVDNNIIVYDNKSNGTFTSKLYEHLWCVASHNNNFLNIKDVHKIVFTTNDKNTYRFLSNNPDYSRIRGLRLAKEDITEIYLNNGGVLINTNKTRKFKSIIIAEIIDSEGDSNTLLGTY